MECFRCAQCSDLIPSTHYNRWGCWSCNSHYTSAANICEALSMCCPLSRDRFNFLVWALSASREIQSTHSPWCRREGWGPPRTMARIGLQVCGSLAGVVLTTLHLWFLLEWSLEEPRMECLDFSSGDMCLSISFVLYVQLCKWVFIWIIFQFDYLYIWPS